MRILSLRVRLVALLCAGTSGMGAVRHRRREAKRAVLVGVVSFVLATLALVVVVDTVAEQWRDPEYAYRLRDLRGWQEESPDRPLVIALGNSRLQMGLSPAAMGFADQAGSPVVYNLGIRGARILGSWLALQRVLDAGVRPAAVLVQVSAWDLAGQGPAERELRPWLGRFSAADLRRLAPYTHDSGTLRRAWIAARINPWWSFRVHVIRDVLPDYLPTPPVETVVGGRCVSCFPFDYPPPMDRFGFGPVPYEAVSPDYYREVHELTTKTFRKALHGQVGVGTVNTRALRDLVSRCRREGIAVAFLWAPESPMFQAKYTREGWEAMLAFERSAAEEFGVEIFPAPDGLLTDDEFADAVHLLPKGAIKYSRWLADSHLKPWLARVLR
jgi:hypothetical protein